MWVSEQAVLPNVLDFSTRLWNIQAEDVIFSVSPPTFDPSILDLLCAVCGGSSLSFAAPSVAARPRDLLHCLRHDGCSILQCTPSQLRLLAAASPPDPSPLLSNLRILCLGGEECPSVGEIRTLLKTEDDLPQCFNLYGQTEISVWTSAVEFAGPNCQPSLLMDASKCRIPVVDWRSSLGNEIVSSSLLAGIRIALEDVESADCYRILDGECPPPNSWYHLWVETPRLCVVDCQGHFECGEVIDSPQSAWRKVPSGDVVEIVSRQEGELQLFEAYFAGRIDDQVKVLGKRYWLNDLQTEMSSRLVDPPESPLGAIRCTHFHVHLPHNSPFPLRLRWLSRVLRDLWWSFHSPLFLLLPCTNPGAQTGFHSTVHATPCHHSFRLRGASSFEL